MNRIYIADNGGETLDRYTIINKTTGDILGASENPFHPMGFGQYCGNVAENYWNKKHGSGWQKGLSKRLLRSRIKFAVDHYLDDCSHIGKKVSISKLPQPVQVFIKQRFDD